MDEPDDPASEHYHLKVDCGDWSKREPAIITMKATWGAIVHDMLGHVAHTRIAARFHAGVAAGFIRAAVLARAATGIQSVALSGGCMHNRRLARLLRSGLEAEGFQVLQHRDVSPGDGGLSYGQAVVAAALLTRQAEASGPLRKPSPAAHL